MRSPTARFSIVDATSRACRDRGCRSPRRGRSIRAAPRRWRRARRAGRRARAPARATPGTSRLPTACAPNGARRRCDGRRRGSRGWSRRTTNEYCPPESSWSTRDASVTSRSSASATIQLSNRFADRRLAERPRDLGLFRDLLDRAWRASSPPRSPAFTRSSSCLASDSARTDASSSESRVTAPPTTAPISWPTRRQPVRSVRRSANAEVWRSRGQARPARTHGVDLVARPRRRARSSRRAARRAPAGRPRRVGRSGSRWARNSRAGPLHPFRVASRARRGLGRGLGGRRPRPSAPARAHALPERTGLDQLVEAGGVGCASARFVSSASAAAQLLDLQPCGRDRHARGFTSASRAARARFFAALDVAIGTIDARRFAKRGNLGDDLVADRARLAGLQRLRDEVGAVLGLAGLRVRCSARSPSTWACSRPSSASAAHHLRRRRAP